MSVENRKRMYDSLISAGREADIDPSLLAEFGTPPAKAAVLPKKKGGGK